jgi:hypothetical protein
MTKGLKAELAGVVILFVLGIISQLRLWKLIKEHREQTSAQRIEKRQNQDREEEELGRNLEDNFQKERAQWEAAYGDKGVPGAAVDSCVSTPRTGRESFASGDVDSTPVPPLPKDGVAKSHIQEIDVTRTHSNHQSNAKAKILNSARPSSDIIALDGVSRNISVRSLQPSAPPPPPVIIPLPFKIPQEDDAVSHVSDHASVSAVPDTNDELFDGRRAVLEPLSSTTVPKSLLKTAPDHSGSEGAMLVPHIEDDRASSIAATMDETDDMLLPCLSLPRSPLSSEFNVDFVQDPTIATPGSISPTAASRNPDVQDVSLTAADDGIKMETAKPNVPHETHALRAGFRQSLTVSTDPKLNEPRMKRETLPSPRPRSDTVVESAKNTQQSKSAGSIAPSSSHTEQSQSNSGSFNGALAGPLSKVAQSYRTNEWAKHLQVAETPELEEILLQESPGAVDHERPTPVSDEIVNPMAAVRRSSKRASNDSTVYQNGAFVRSNSNTSGLSQAERQSMSRSPSVLASGMARTASTAHLPTVLEPSMHRTSPGPLPKPDNTLMGQREALVQRRTSSQSFNPQSPSQHPLIRGGHDMTLAARKRALQNKHQQPPSAAEKWQKKSSWAAGNQVEGFDSHQPKRMHTSGSDQKREVLLADWRESIRRSGTPGQSAAAMVEEQRRAALNAKRQEETEKQHQSMVAQQRESIRQSMMRNNGMLDAHREAMRKMQAAANKHA